jgi:8-oxo-dGTP pyrophosphatase MutT (NUDIX family)
MPTPEVIRQAAAIPLHEGRICLISSRSGKRWVIPKGCMEPGMTSGETALQEAWEEAGLAGVLLPEPVGSYVYEKAGFLYHVTVFVMEVTEVLQEWPEREWRQRIWLSYAQAVSRIQEPGLREIIRGVVVSKASS